MKQNGFLKGTIREKEQNRHTEIMPVLFFFLLTFLISWSFWIPMVILNKSSRLLLAAGTFGPTLSALAILLIQRDRHKLKEIGRRLVRWQVNIGWYLFSFFSTPLAVLAAIRLYRLTDGGPLQFNDPSQWYLAVPVFLYVLFLSVLGEEIGWRGYALPILQQKYTALKASLALGLVWFLWHLPLFHIPGDFHAAIPLLLFFLQIMALSVIYTWIYNNSGGSLLLMHLFHAASNTTLGLLPVLPMDTGGDLRPLWITVAILLITTTGIIILYGPRTLSKTKVTRLP